MRQRDSLFPYLFLICIEGLVSLLKNTDSTGNLRGIQVCREAPPISHLLFVDNGLVFCQANKSSSEQLLDSLSRYAKALGQCVNIEKTQMVFSRNVPNCDRKDILAFRGVRSTNQYERYLGLPPIINRSRKSFFGDKVKNFSSAFNHGNVGYCRKEGDKYFSRL